ncbi:unnamed protein product, partial [Didymodactylos carnosus]
MERGMRCWNSTLCIDTSKLCNGRIDCQPYGDDEEILCPWLEKYPVTVSTNEYTLYTCKNGKLFGRRCQMQANLPDFIFEELHCKDLEDLMLCDLNDKSTTKYFTTSDFIEYPLIINSYNPKAAIEHNTNNNKNNSTTLIINSLLDIANLTWYCNRGIIVLTHPLASPSSSNRLCLCPPSYYGDRCQYQSDRLNVFLSIYKPTAFEGSLVFKILIFLLDDQNRIQSSEELVYMNTKFPIFSCQPQYSIYLLYPTQPRRINITYYVRIDVFGINIIDNKIQYRSSWNFDIPFQKFLPVYRIVIEITIPEQVTRATVSCSDYNLTCIHGYCVQYVNTLKTFCHCHEGYSGISCDVKDDCSHCLKGSLCIGRVCQLGYIGERCYIPYELCQKDSCYNGGTCIALDRRTKVYTCLCLDQYYGNRCENKSAILYVSFASNNQLSILDVILIHSFVTSPSMMNYRRTTIKRIPLYQYKRTIVYYTQQYLPHLIFVQVFELSSLKKNELEYYLLAVTEHNRDLTELSTTIVSLNRCINITRLLNRTIMKFTRYKRVKFYQNLVEKIMNYDVFMMNNGCVF